MGQYLEQAIYTLRTKNSFAGINSPNDDIAVPLFITKNHKRPGLL